MSSVTITLARCQVRETVDGTPNVLCWGTLAIQDGDLLPPILPCGHESTGADAQRVQGEYSAEHGCDPRCEGATGPACFCACGGVNHGRSWLLVEAAGFHRGPGNSVMWDGSPYHPERVEAVRAHFRTLNAEPNRARAIQRIVNRHVGAARAAQARREAAAAQQDRVRVAWLDASPDNAEAAGWLDELAAAAHAGAVAEGEEDDPALCYIEDGFLASVWGQLRRHGTLSTAQVAAVLRSRERYDERQQRDRERAERAARSQYVGREGERIEIDVTVTFTRFIEGDRYDRFSPDKTLVGMEDAAGNQLRTFSTGAFGGDVREGDRLRLRGTVKKHEEYHGTRQTILTRCTVVETAPAGRRA